MWPRANGRIGPPQMTPIIEDARYYYMLGRLEPAPEERRVEYVLSQVLPYRHNTHTLYLGPSCVLTSFVTWIPPYTYSLIQIPSLTLLELHNVSRRPYCGVYRGMHPYRISLSERMNRYRPSLHSLDEEESNERTVNAQGPRRSLRIKSHRRNHSRNNNRPPPPEPIHHRSGELQIIPAVEWATQSNRLTTWRADAPEIIISSDAQLQTEDSGVVIPLVYPSTSTSNIMPQGNPEAISNSETYYHTSVNGDSSSSLTDRATQIPPEPNDDSNRDDDMSGAGSNNLPRSSAPLPPLPSATLGSRQVANRVIKHARNNKALDEKLLRCLDCKLLPTLPVTGQCGHTRCTRCIKTRGGCPCGSEAPDSLHVNTAIQYILEKMLPDYYKKRDSLNPASQAEGHGDNSVQKIASPAQEPSQLYSQRLSGQSRGLGITKARNRKTNRNVTGRVPMSPRIQYEHARRLLSVGRHREAAPHLARVAASGEPVARNARAVLSQVLVSICEGRDPRRVTRDLFRSVRLQSAASWLRPSDLECVLCYHTYTRPVTTPCGHTYCKTCIERAMDYKKICALCQRSLEGFDLAATKETTALVAALESIDASGPQLPPDPDVIPIFVCTVAYPSIPCPLFIFDPRYWLMIRRVLESDSRKFGMVAYERDRTYSDYGTILEVCDCVHLEDGRSFLSTVGVSRFRVIERDVRDGCDVARIQPLVDITPAEQIVVIDMRLMGSQILYKALVWLNNMNKTVRSEIETAFGQIPQLSQVEEDWWNSPDGPAWLWWLIAILPLRSEIKVLILSTKNLRKRMMAVARTLEAIDQASITTTATSECEIRSALTNADEWLERGS